jgi:hypothetical protein
MNMFKWLKDWRESAARRSIATLTKNLSERQPPDWRSIDNTVIKGTAAGQMWTDEVRILKKLAEYGSLAKASADSVVQAAEQNLWGHCQKDHRTHKPGCSELGRAGLLVSVHTDVHLSTLLQTIVTLTAIGTEASTRAPTLLADILTESKPPAEWRIDAMRHGAEQAIRLGAIHQMPDDVPYRSAIRGLALNLVARIGDSLRSEDSSTSELGGNVIVALDDTSFAVRFSAVGALEHMKSVLPREKFREAVPRVLSILQSQEAVQAFGAQRRHELDEVVVRWQTYASS